MRDQQCYLNTEARFPDCWKELQGSYPDAYRPAMICQHIDINFYYSFEENGRQIVNYS